VHCVHPRGVVRQGRLMSLIPRHHDLMLAHPGAQHGGTGLPLAASRHSFIHQDSFIVR
jgi:hypothetical protein